MTRVKSNATLKLRPDAPFCPPRCPKSRPPIAFFQDALRDSRTRRRGSAESQPFLAKARRSESAYLAFDFGGGWADWNAKAPAEPVEDVTELRGATQLLTGWVRRFVRATGVLVFACDGNFRPLG
jgi:hypothetical protein